MKHRYKADKKSTTYTSMKEALSTSIGSDFFILWPEKKGIFFNFHYIDRREIMRDYKNYIKHHGFALQTPVNISFYAKQSKFISFPY